MKAEFDTITIVLCRGDDEWPSSCEQQSLIDDIVNEFDVIDINGPYASGRWLFIMRERDIAAAVTRVNELIREHTGR